MWLNKTYMPRVEAVEDNRKCCNLLDLPELALENILHRLSAESLCAMSGVNRELRAKSSKDHTWEPLLNAKWGKLLGERAHKEWHRSLLAPSKQKIVSSSADDGGGCIGKLWRWPLSCIWPFFLLFPDQNVRKPIEDMSIHSLMALYSALECGKFWFQAQVYNREHGHVGFMLSCYDAELSYDRGSDSFTARYPPHGPHTLIIEEGVKWERLRASPVDTCAHNLHLITSLVGLNPGDHVEVQWRRNKEFPYGWWYGVVGHLDMCDGGNHCRCHLNDTVWLEFNQYTLGSRWRRWAVSRHTHHEEGDEAEGFYGGIRKLQSTEEINTWKGLWPKETLA